MKAKCFIIVAGNPVDGFEFYGPFDSAVEASEVGNTDPHMEMDWWVAEVNELNED